jgi:methionyl-tRNA synthetase
LLLLLLLLLLCHRAQTEICQSLFNDLHAAGNIAEQTMEQLYSEAAGKFLADRFVVGTCPKCKYEVRRYSTACTADMRQYSAM